MASNENRQPTDPGLLGYLTGLYAIVFIGYLGLRRGLGGWYAGLIHPNGALPVWAFGPLWALFSLLLGYVGWRLYTASKSKSRSLALIALVLMVAFSSVWAWALFGFQRPIGAMISVGLALLLGVPAVAVGAKAKSGAALLLSPYLMWLCYAGFLTYAIYSANFKNGEGVSHIETIID